MDEFDYDLPEELVAQHPLEQRHQSRLMVVDPLRQTVLHTAFAHIRDYLRRGDVLVVNNSKVLPARLFGVKPDTGGRIELMLVRRLADLEWEALCRPAKRFRLGTEVEFSSGGKAVVVAEGDDGLRRVRFAVDEGMEAFLQRAGEVPLPPYIRAPLQNPNRYQTVYAKHAGSVAAPTAGLHFTDELLADIRSLGVHVAEVTLHVGLGTFRPVQVGEVEEHTMHSEWYEVPGDVADKVNEAHRAGGRVIAVGTTAMRTLESAGQTGVVRAGSGETSIFIYPGYRFRVVDALVTNFHLPKSTLLMLVAAMMGTEFVKQAYAEAVRERYRFFSFGDAMFITGRCQDGPQSGMV